MNSYKGNFSQISSDVFKIVYCSLENLPIHYDFVKGLPDNFGEYMDNPKRFINVKKDVEIIYIYFLERTIDSYQSGLIITKREAAQLRKQLGFKKLKNLGIYRSSWEIEPSIKGKKDDKIKNLIQGLSIEQRGLLERILRERRDGREIIGEEHKKEKKKDRKAKVFREKIPGVKEKLVKIAETDDPEEVKALVLGGKLEKARQEISKETEIEKEKVVEDKELIKEDSVPMEIPPPEDKETEELVGEKTYILVICPKCQGKKKVAIPTDLVLLTKSLTSISIRPGVCCEHLFSVFVDKNGKIRGYQKNDLEIQEKPLDVDSEGDLIKDNDLKEVLLESIEEIPLKDDFSEEVEIKKEIKKEFFDFYAFDLNNLMISYKKSGNNKKKNPIELIKKKLNNDDPKLVYFFASQQYKALEAEIPMTDQIKWYFEDYVKNKATGSYVDVDVMMASEISMILQAFKSQIKHLYLGSGDKDFHIIIENAQKLNIPVSIIVASKYNISSEMEKLVDFNVEFLYPDDINTRLREKVKNKPQKDVVHQQKTPEIPGLEKPNIKNFLLKKKQN